MNKVNQKDMTLRDLIKVIFRHKILILLCFVTIMTSVYISLDLRVPVYSSGVRILVTGTMQRDIDVARNLGPGSLVATQMSLVKSRPILERTVEALKLHQRPLDYKRRNASKLKKILMDNKIEIEKSSLEEMSPNQRRAYLFNRTVQDLFANISVYLEPETSIFNIIVRDYNSRNSGLIANVLSRSYVIFDLEQQIAALQLTYGSKNETIVKLEKHIEHIKETLDGRMLSDIEALGPATVKIITQAGPGNKLPLRPSKASGLIAAFVISMALGVTLAFGFDFFNMKFRSSNDVEKFLHIPYLGSVTKRKSNEDFLIEQTNSVSKYAQLIQKLSNRIYMAMKDQNSNAILFTDAEESEETSLITANLGICLARKSGYKVLVIDADLRNPSFHDIFNIPNDPGLTGLIEGKIDLENAIHDLGSNLSVLPAGDATVNPVLLLESDRMFDIVKEAKELYEIVFVKTSDIKNFSDAIILSSCTDSILFVINEGNRRQIVQTALDPFKQREIKMLGAVLNNHKQVIPEIIYRLT